MPAVERALDVLEFLEVCEGRPTLSEIASRLNLPKASAHRLLGTLKARGYIEQSGSRGGYGLAARVLGLASRAEHQLDIVRIAYEPMQQLSEATGEVCQLSVLSAARALCVARIVSSPHAEVSALSRVGATLPLHASAVGKALLAFLPDAERERYLAQPLDGFTPHTKADLEALRRDLEEIRRVGIAYDDQEYRLGLRAFAAPVFGHEGTVTAALGVIHSAAITGDDTWEIKEALRATAMGVSRALGHNS